MKLKTEQDNLVRDSTSNALINTDVSAFTLYKQRREANNFNNNLEKEIKDIKADISEIKYLLGLLIKQTIKET